jgi:hypothetical protein
VRAGAATGRGNVLPGLPVAAMVIGSPNARVNRFLKFPRNPRETGTSRIPPLRRPVKYLRTIHPDI